MLSKKILAKIGCGQKKLYINKNPQQLLGYNNHMKIL